MPVTGELVGWAECRYFTNLFDDGKAEAVMACMLLSLIEAGEHPPRIEWNGEAGIADAEPAGFQRDINNALRDVVVAGVAEEVVEEDIDQLGACTDGGGQQVGCNFDTAGLPKFPELSKF